MNEVTIIMATFNGEKYLSDLLESICKQSFTNWELIIRDDCSSDNTAKILQKYAEKDQRIKVSLGKERLGATRNFAWLTAHDCTGDYIMFCDQDDVWLPEKIELTLTEMKSQENKHGKDECHLIFCEKKIVNAELEEIDNHKHKSNNEDYSLKNILIRNPIYGCTMMINRKLLEKAGIIPDYVQTHDYYYSLYAASYGTITKVSKPLLLYRQHDNNVTGGLNNYGAHNKLKTISRINRKLHETIRQNYYFCVEKTVGEPDAEKYVDVVKSKGIIRVIKAYRYGFKTNAMLSTIRLYWALLTYKSGT